ncbi:MAG: molybdopterin-guanine dinucleotide biosynthesis protein B [Planctomycetota bacterium]|jgi:molybdopterin-guanine dinucleotide biosynthesis protein B
MNRIHIVGKKNHGKTTLIVALIEELTRQGVRVGAIKHSAHAHELDTPGKDSYRQRRAGARPAAVVTADLIGLYVPRTPKTDFYELVAPMFRGCDLVLVEGHLDCDGVKVEVWRREAGETCLAAGRSDVAAVVSDDQPEVDVPVWPRSDLPRLAANVRALAGCA